jgi:hypothetical protein
MPPGNPGIGTGGSVSKSYLYGSYIAGTYKFGSKGGVNARTSRLNINRFGMYTTRGIVIGRKANGTAIAMRQGNAGRKSIKGIGCAAKIPVEPIGP